MEQIEEFVPLLSQAANLRPQGLKAAKGGPPSEDVIKALNAASLRCMQAYMLLWCRPFNHLQLQGPLIRAFIRLHLAVCCACCVHVCFRYP